MDRSSRPTKAVILAAGKGSRVGGAARGLPKPLLSVAGVPILHRALRCLSHVGVRDVVIVIGHRGSEIVSSVREALLSNDLQNANLTVSYIVSDRYETTNNIYSLWLAREHLDQDIYLLEGDIVFDVELLRAFHSESAVSVAGIVPYEFGMTGTVVQLNGENRVQTMFDIRGEEPSSGGSYKTISLFMLHAALLQEVFVPMLERFVQSGRLQEYWEAALSEALRESEHPLVAVDCSSFRWCEIDDISDWMNADIIFSEPDKRLALINQRYGRFQSYGATDHLVMTNIYFPPEAMRRDICRELDALITDYPSGQATLARLLAGAIDQSPENLVVGNGASELIRILGRITRRRALVPVPTFNEYEDTFFPDKLLRFELNPPKFHLDIHRFLDIAEKADIELAVVVSPNNPTSVTVPRDELLWLCKALGRDGKLLLVDETFVDFCVEPSNQSLADQVSIHNNLMILKSLSPSCGVPGLRLGYLLTGNAELSSSIRRQLPIWNVNSVAEAFLRLLPRYKGFLAETCRQVRSECDELHALLSVIPGLQTNPPSANFCFVRVTADTDVVQVVQRLLTDHNILVKECSGKSLLEGLRYLRVKSRTPEENKRFAEALAQVLSSLP